MKDGRKGPARVAAISIDRFVTGLLCAATASFFITATLTAQPAPPAPAPAADLNQLMRGLFFPHSNVIFATQRLNPAEIKHAPEPSAASDPLTGVFGNWEAVENSALTLSDAADLLMTPGRKCANGRDVPLRQPEWTRLVNQLREAGKYAYKAAQSKDMENMIKASEVLNTSCAECHNKYRPRVLANRCQ